MSFISPAPQGTETRTDQGVDWGKVRGNIVAVASGTIVNIYSGLSGFGTTIIERLSTGQEVYYAEESGGGTPVVHVGQAVAQGQALAPGTGGVIEAGFWDPSTGRSAGAPGYHEGMVTAAGTAFRNRIRGGGAAQINWKPCTLTWYDPALGGINTTGAANPTARTASGQPYSATADTCAAPPQYPFGTIITFRYGGKTVVCRVNDRGGAITGSHFDLSRHAASTLGIINAGEVTAEFVVGTAGVGTAVGSAITRPGGGSSEDTGAEVEKVLADYEALRTLPRSAPTNGFTSPSKAGWKAPFTWWWQSFTSQWETEQGQ